LCGLSNFFAFYHSAKNAEEKGVEIIESFPWWRFEGVTYVDCALLTNLAVIFVKGKWIEVGLLPMRRPWLTKQGRMFVMFMPAIQKIERPLLTLNSFKRSLQASKAAASIKNI
jgi:hypothetical protein